MDTILNRTAIVGIGQTEFSKFSGRSELQLALEASKAALDDAGLSPSDIDGAVTFTLDSNDESALIRNLGVRQLRWTARTPRGGAGGSARPMAGGSAGRHLGIVGDPRRDWRGRSARPVESAR